MKLSETLTEVISQLNELKADEGVEVDKRLLAIAITQIEIGKIILEKLGF